MNLKYTYVVLVVETEMFDGEPSTLASVDAAFTDRDAALAYAAGVLGDYDGTTTGYDSIDDALQAFNETDGRVRIDVLPVVVTDQAPTTV